MKKTSNLGGLLGVIALIFTLCAFLFPIAPGVQAGADEFVRGYDFVFTNPAAPFTISATGGLVAMFVLFIVGAAFELLGVAFGWYGGKFGGFLSIVGGLCMAVAGILAFLAPAMVEAPQFQLTLAWGFIATAISALLAAAVELFIGVKAFLAK